MGDEVIAYLTAFDHRGWGSGVGGGLADGPGVSRAVARRDRSPRYVQLPTRAPITDIMRW